MTIQQMLLGAGKPPTKYYIDDVFSMDPYYGKTAYPYNVLGHIITTGVNIKDDGGFVWIKTRENTFENLWFSPLMGVGKNITPASAAAMVTQGGRITQYKTDGFKLASDQSVNHTDKKVMSWSFKNSKGFFSHVEWTGNGTARTISHDLGCKPGFIAVKGMSQGGNWTVWHRGMNKGVTPHNYYQRLNVGGGLMSDYQPFTAEPTSTGFAIIADNSNDYEAYMNKSGETYKAWVWAGGASDAATAKSVEFDGSNDRLDVAASTDFNLGTNDFTIDYWINTTDTGDAGLMSISNAAQNSNISWMTYMTDGKMQFYWSTNGSSWAGVAQTTKTVNDGQWHHVAMTRTGGNIRIYLDGVLDETEDSISSSSISSSTLDLGIGHIDQGTWFDGKLSNVRIVNGTAVYTSSFRPPTEPLTNITNTKLLCCNDSSTTGKTVGPTITANGPTASSDSPFDDSGNFIFGPDGDQNVIKTGYYIGNGDSTNGLEVELGFEPQFLWIKADGTGSDANYNWLVFDTMRGMDNEKMDNTHESGRLYSSNNGAEVDTDDGINVLPTGFKIQGNNDDRNGDGHQYIYIAIRASEGYVSKVPEAGSDVFNMDTGSDSATIPTYDSGFPVDFSTSRTPASSGNWFTSARLMSGKTLYTNTAEAESTRDFSCYDSNVGFDKDTWGPGSSTYQAWMWKRHAGFDVVAYMAKGGSFASYAHSLGKIPEMIWVKRRDSSQDWSVYHKGLNGGSSPEGYGIKLNTTAAEASSTTRWASTAPTSTHFFAGGNTGTNTADSAYVAMLFASVDGISKVGEFDGSDSTLTITTGFQPRFVIIKKTTVAGGDWYVFDTTRGWGSGDDKWLKLNDSYTQGTSDEGGPTSTGFTIGGNTDANDAGQKFIYYAHA